jgi:CheY-like chemotaxis protein
MESFEKQIFLLAEDSENDAFLMQTAFKKAALPNPLQIVSDGEEAIAYLEGLGRYRDREQFPLPIVVLLDLKMPRKTGFEVLEWIRRQPTLKRIIVIILTASNRRVDADRAYDLGANFYLTKPGKFDELVQMTQCLYEWLRLNHFPSVTQPASASLERSLRTGGTPRNSTAGASNLDV